MGLTRVGVVGGGLAGLTAARAIAAAGVDVVLFEASGRCGGQVRTFRTGDWILEDGAEGFPARRPAIPSLCTGLGLRDAMLEQLTRRNLGLRGSRLHRLKTGRAAQLLGMAVDPEDQGRGLRTLRGGMESLVDAMVRELTRQATIRTGTTVARVSRDGDGWWVVLPSAEPVPLDGVILALPARQADGLLAPHLGGRTLLGRLPLASSLAVTLVFRRAAVRHQLQATGFVVDRPHADGLLACTFTTSKFAARADPSWCVLRTFFRPQDARSADDDATWAGRAHRALDPILGLREDPALARVVRWPDALPRFPHSHGSELRRLRRSLGALGAIELAGAAADGGGVDGAVRSGRAAAARMMHRLRRVARPRS